ncbi:hypothetical protein FLM9_1470 [Candidatus Synechococcus spongiarum]|uniref:Uncharacterized protein n=1 Tax=Candidatus Synechococcus spongiarum TaxID=431041 RepID=A0A164Z6J8_9SYNE|nr:hypothetical protein FLM9_1470 [Candidatus Synechococcus spongiarum]
MLVTPDRDFVSGLTTVSAALDGSSFVMPGGQMRWDGGL